MEASLSLPSALSQRQLPLANVRHSAQPPLLGEPRQPFQPGCESSLAPTRRDSLLAFTGLLAAGLGPLGGTPAAQAGLVSDYVKGIMRPEMTTEQALLGLMYAKGTLNELKKLAATPMNSRERFESRALLPGMAKRLREVGAAAPVVAALAAGDKEASVSALYGGRGGAEAVTDNVYNAIGKVVTISGRTIRPEALAEPALAEAAIKQIDELLGLARAAGKTDIVAHMVQASAPRPADGLGLVAKAAGG